MASLIDRREFLKQAGVGAAAATLAGAGASGAVQSGMFVSLPPWAVARNVGWPEQARLAARVGYKGIDWAWGPARQAGAEATRALLAELQIQPTIVNLPVQNPFGGDDAEFLTKMPQLEDDAAFCSSIGCRNFQVVLGATVPPGQTKEQRWESVVSRLKAMSGVLSRHDVRLGMEFLGPLQFRAGRGGGGRRGGGAPDPNAPPPAPPAPFVYTLTETVKLATEAGPNVGATLDAWHWYHSGGTVADIVATDASRVIHVHVSDAKQLAPEDVRDNMRLLCGEGVIDLVGFFGALRRIGYSGGVAPETIGPRIPDDMPPEESARLALEATTGVMRKAGVL